MKVFVFPPSSLILADLVERGGHEPLAVGTELRERVTSPEIDSPPLNVTREDVIRGVKYVATEAPSGVKGRMGVIGPLIEEAGAAIIIKDADFTFGCSGCDRTDSVIKYMLREREIPILETDYPSSEEEAKIMVKQIMDFLENLSK